MVHGGGHHHSEGGGVVVAVMEAMVEWSSNTTRPVTVFIQNSHTSGWNSYQQSYIHPQTFYTNRPRQQQFPPNVSRWWCQLLTVSVVLFFICFFLMYSFTGSDEDWTLNAGETRQVVGASGWLTNGIAISTNVPGSVAIYAIDGVCPPLTGPTIQIANTETIQLAQGDYQYDYFFLNAGSILDVSLQQDYGASNLMVMRGLGAVQGDDEGQSDDNGSFSSKAILTRYAGATQIAQVQFVAPTSDTYVVVYENASNSKGRATVTYQVDLASYELIGQTPVSVCGSSSVCNLAVGGGRKCILVSALSEVTVHISMSRRLALILFYSIVLVSLVACFFLQKRKQQDSFENPPATAPGPHQSEYVTAEPLVSVPAASVYPMATAIPESEVTGLLPTAPFQNKL